MTQACSNSIEPDIRASGATSPKLVTNWPGGPAASAQLHSPGALAVDATGSLYIADNDRVRYVYDGLITTVAGGGSASPGDNGLATGARLDSPAGLAVDSAHKLAGVLGTFGLPRGTDLAREAEVLFGQPTPPGKVDIERLQVLLAELTTLIDRGPLGPS